MAESINNVKQQVLSKSWNWLNDNFHKFSDGNKIKVTLALSLKDMPTQLQGEINFNKTPSIELGGKELEYELGSRITQYTKEAGNTTP